MQSELIRQYKEEQNTDELHKAQNRKAVLNNQLKKTEEKLLKVEDTKVAKELLERSRSRSIVENQAEEETLNRIETYYRDRMAG